MPAYVILDVVVTDPDRYEDYKKVSGATLEIYGGRFLVRGGAVERVEGDWTPSRIVVLEFESMERAKEWYDSEEYRGPKAIRQEASSARMIFVEGSDPA